MKSQVTAFVEDTNVVAEIGTDGSSVEPIVQQVIDEVGAIKVTL